VGPWSGKMEMVVRTKPVMKSESAVGPEGVSLMV
jgi:hypothetical protein